MECWNCGEVLSEDAKFCEKCGERVKDNNISYSSPAPVQTNPTTTVSEHLTTGGWFGRILVSWIPIVGLVMLFVWAFGNTLQPSLRTWARAQLIFILIAIGLYIFFIIAGSALFASASYGVMMI